MRAWDPATSQETWSPDFWLQPAPTSSTVGIWGAADGKCLSHNLGEEVTKGATGTHSLFPPL